MKENREPIEANTIIELFERSCAKWPDNPCMWEKKSEKYKPTSYKQIREKAMNFGAGLQKLGIKKGDRISLLSEGRNDWLISELGILYAGAINVPLSTKLDGETEVVFRIIHSESRFVILSGFQSPKVEENLDKLNVLEKIIYLDKTDNFGEKGVSFSEVSEIGKQYLETEKETFENCWKNIQPNDYANICYTSGTTADPKGIILSHLNYAANTRQANTLMSIDDTFKTLAILPWDHSFAHTACLYSFLVNGASIGSIQQGKTPQEAIRNVPTNIKEFQPDIMMSVPALAKNFRKNIEKGIRAKKAEKLFNFAISISYKYQGDGWNRGKGFRAFYKPLVSLFDKILFSKIRENFGGKLKFFIGGGALLDVELQKFFYAIGIPMCQGYGLSESSPVISSNALHAIKFGSSGKLVKYLEIKICNEKREQLPIGEHGEIVIKGDNVMVGYWKNEEATKKTIIDGWLHTGDLGYMDNTDFLYVLGRYKSLLISNDGEKFSPEGIEEAMTEKSKYIDQCMLYNNQNPYTTALIVPNKGRILHHLKELNLSPQSEEGQREALRKMESEINEYRKGGKFEGMFPERWLPAASAILNESFNDENHLMNSTMKIVRGKIETYFKDRIDLLYTPEGKNIQNTENRKTISQIEVLQN